LLGPIGLVACDAAAAIAIISLLVQVGKLVYAARESVSGDVSIENKTDEEVTIDLRVSLRDMGGETQDMYDVELRLPPGETTPYAFDGLYSQKSGLHVIAALADGEEAVSECFAIGESSGNCKSR